MALLSKMVKSSLEWSMRVGIRPFGLSEVYSALLCSPLVKSR